MKTSITVQIKGVAIIMVIIRHLCIINFISLPEGFHFWGQGGVTIFLILSGFGLVQSYFNNGLNNFFSKRFTKVLLPYFFVTVVWIIVDYLILGKTYTLKTILLSLIGMDFDRTIDFSMWFITYILFWYLIFFLSFSLPVNNSVKILLLLFAGFVFWTRLLDGIFPARLSNMFSFHAYFFPLGVLAGIIYSKFNNLLNTRLLLGAIIFCTGLLSLFLDVESHNTNMFRAVTLVFGLLLITLVKLASNYEYKSKFLTFIGSISYELYLFEWVFMSKYNVLTRFNDKWLSLILYICLIVTLSVILKMSVQKICISQFSNLFRSKDKTLSVN